MLDELEWPSLEAQRDQSSLLLFHKIHCEAVSIEKDEYMTPAHSLKTGAQWLSGRVLDSRPKGCGFEPHRRHCVVVLERFILA